MLRHLGQPEAADRVETALRDVVAEGRATTADLGGPAGTREFADAIVERLGSTSANGRDASATARVGARA
jgi:isocitrate dehydrogenase (NAD+)